MFKPGYAAKLVRIMVHERKLNKNISIQMPTAFECKGIIQGSTLDIQLF